MEQNFSKTPKMLRYEREHNCNLQKVILENFAKYGTLEATANAMSVHYSTLYQWMLRLGISIRKTVTTIEVVN